MTDERIVISGVGIVAACGVNAEACWDSLVTGATGLQPASGEWQRRFGDQQLGRCHVGSLSLTGGDGTQWTPPRVVTMALTAVDEALEMSGLALRDVDRDRVGVFVGTCMGSAYITVGSEGLSKERGQRVGVSGDSLQFLADVVAARLATTGPRLVINTACSSGATAFAVAKQHLGSGLIDVAIVGGADELSPLSLKGFSSVGALDRERCSPYGRSQGLNMGEGAAFFMLERADRVARRGAVAIAEVLGCGLSADALSPTAPDPTGEGAELAIRRALQSAGVELDDVDYVNGHGTGTSANDSMELAMFERLFTGTRARPWISSTKGATGHAFAGTAAIEIAVSAFAVQRGITPPTLGLPNCANSDGTPIDVAISTSYAFGGNNACVVVGNPGRAAPKGESRRFDDVVVTGIGAVGAPGLGRAAWWDSFGRGEEVHRRVIQALPDGREIRASLAEAPQLTSERFANRRQWRRMDALARLGVAATQLALDDAEAQGLEGNDEVAVIVGTASGPIEAATEFESAVISGAPINPAGFANTVMNSTSGHVCSRFGWRGPTATFTSGWNSSVHALAFAADTVRAGNASAAIVVCADLICSAVLADLCDRGLLTKTRDEANGSRALVALASSAVAFVLEPRSAAQHRGATPLVTLRGATTGGPPTLTGDLPTDPDLWKRCMTGALVVSDRQPEQVDLVMLARNGVLESDEAEQRAASEIFGAETLMLRPKEWIGEACGASGAVSLVSLASVLSGAVDAHRGSRPRTAILNTGSLGGSCATLVAEACDD